LEFELIELQCSHHEIQASALIKTEHQCRRRGGIIPVHHS